MIADYCFSWPSHIVANTDKDFIESRAYRGHTLEKPESKRRKFFAKKKTKKKTTSVYNCCKMT